MQSPPYSIEEGAENGRCMVLGFGISSEGRWAEIEIKHIQRNHVRSGAERDAARSGAERDAARSGAERDAARSGAERDTSASRIGVSTLKRMHHPPAPSLKKSKGGGENIPPSNSHQGNSAANDGSGEIVAFTC